MSKALAPLLKLFTPESSDGGIDGNIVVPEQNVLKAGYLLLLFLFGGFGAWAVFAPLESAAHAVGKVQVEGASKPVQHLEGGIVSQILVGNGDYVERGAALLILDGTQYRAEQDIVQGRIWAHRALVDRLIAERDGLKTVEFSSLLLSSPDERALVSRESELANFQARKSTRLGEIEVTKQRIKSLRNDISGTQAVLDAKVDVANSLREEIEELETLLTEGYVDKQRIRELNRSLVQILGEISDLRAKVDSSEVAIVESELKILQINQNFKTRVIDELSQTQDALFDLNQQAKAVGDRVERTTIRAPNSGFILGLEVNTIGAVISPRQEILSIVPDIDRLVVRAQLSPMDIDRVKLGQEAEVRFSVFKDAYSVTGTLLKLSPDSLIDDVTGMPYFDATVELWHDDLALLGSYKLVPGMPAEVLIKTGSRTFLAYVTSPIQNMFANSMIEE